MHKGSGRDPRFRRLVGTDHGTDGTDHGTDGTDHGTDGTDHGTDGTDGTDLRTTAPTAPTSARAGGEHRAAPATRLRRVVIELRPMTEADLARVEVWMRQPHVARWWPPETVAAEVEDYRQRVNGEGDLSTVLLVVTEDGVPVGWCQWYRWDSYPAEAAAMDALPGEVGIDYAVGEPGAVGRGLGTELIAALVTEVRCHEPGAGLLVDPDAANLASRRVLERNGFELVAVRPVATEPTDDPMAIYRLPALGDPRPGGPGAGDRVVGGPEAGDRVVGGPGAGAPGRGALEAAAGEEKEAPGRGALEAAAGEEKEAPGRGALEAAAGEETEAPGRVLLVDAANVVGSRPDGWWRDRAGAARRLVGRLDAATAAGRLDPPVIVVLEGAARAGAAVGDRGGLRVVHAAGSGDDLLVQLAGTASPPVALVSADRELRRRVTALGGRCVGPDWLYRRLGGG